MWFEKIKYYYDTGTWNQKMVANAVGKGKITQEEYERIISSDRNRGSCCGSDGSLVRYGNGYLGPTE